MSTECGKHRFDRIAANADHRFAFVGNVQRIDAEQLARRARGIYTLFLHDALLI